MPSGQLSFQERPAFQILGKSVIFKHLFLNIEGMEVGLPMALNFRVKKIGECLLARWCEMKDISLKKASHFMKIKSFSFIMVIVL